ncbi:hypothetical protein DFH08DRAFT_1070375 [Mycena albidolilacea]|uniref:Apple domain-containing protein n=1 Tax=Mycena albidolilacea TaxID=1033008 RepID=A0AAD7F3Y8_9AGAR|nr:hypothetical protein DFH08DRAFT_1070375 [Mycena albidolilacea]
MATFDGSEDSSSVYPGWDMDNGGSGTIFNVTERACVQSCGASSTCVAYAYVPFADPTPFCVLKNAIDLSTFKIQSFDVSVGLLGACGTFAPVGPMATMCFTATVLA